MNKLFLSGTITRDCELLETKGDLKFTKVSIAVDRPYTSENGEKQTDYFTITLWGKKAEYYAKKGTKGSKVNFLGMLQNKKYTDKDGNTKYENQIVVSEEELFTKNSDGNSKKSSSTKKDKQGEDNYKNQMQIDEDDLPF